MKRRKSMSNDFTPDRRVVYKGISRSAKDWIIFLGYDYEEVSDYAHNRHIPMANMARKLIDYCYEEGDCTYPMKKNRKPEDMVGMRFGRLTVIEKAQGQNARGQTYVCKCDCGKYRKAHRIKLITGEIRSCGCLRRDYQSVFANCKRNMTENPCRRLKMGERDMTITEWSRQPDIVALGIKRRNIYSRLRAGWSIERTLTEPSHTRN